MHFMGFYPFIVAFGCIVRRRSRVEFRITLRKLRARVEERRLLEGIGFCGAMYGYSLMYLSLDPVLCDTTVDECDC